MSNITDWIKTELYPNLFDSIDIALPEHNFKKYPGGWRSKTYLDGSPHKDREDKTVISKKAPGLILENGGEVVGLVDYVIKRDNVEFIKAVKTLADAVGLELPINPEFNPEEYKKYKDQATLLEACNSYFIYCIEHSTGAKDVLKYLNERGYTPEDIKLMEIGYIPDQEKTVKYLLNKNYSQALIDEVLKLNGAIGSTHKITIPYRSGGLIKGFKFRTIGDATPKYLNSSGLDKIGGFFNLSGIKGDKDVIIVEGELDSLHATVKGLNNVVSTGGSSVNKEQIKDAVKRGAKSFTICFDTEPGKEEITTKNINTAIEVILGEGVNNVYIVILPALKGGKTDPDRLIKENGVESFKDAIKKATPYYIYKLDCIINKYNSIDEITYKELKSFEEEIVETGSKIKEPTDKDSYLKQAIKCFNEIGITEESLSIAVDRLTSTRDKEAQAKEFKKLLTEATALQDKGYVDKALELLDSRVKDVKATSGKGLLPTPLDFTTLLNDIANTPPSYKTGYRTLDKFIGFTPGAITLIAGRPSHGKTTFMFNLLLQMSNIYKDEVFYFFSYEEPVKNISIKLLNRLTATDLSKYYGEYNSLSKSTNYEFLKAYIKDNRIDIPEIEKGKRLLKDLIDSQKIKIIDINYSVEQLSKIITYLNKTEKIGGVFIDYIQRMKTDRRTQDKRTEIAHISDMVLQIAKETGLPIILGAQLNRATQGNAGKKPALDNLKEAGNLEEDANTVISVYNESREKDETEEGDSYKGLREVDLEIKTLKNREGEVNQTATLIFDKWTGLIKDKATPTESYFNK